MDFDGNSWFQVGFYSYQSVFIVRGGFFIVTGVFFRFVMAPGLVS